MRRSIFVLLFLGVMTATPALAGAIVIGTGVGRDCYVATLASPSMMHDTDALAACDRAIQDYSVSSHDRAAALINRSEILIRLRRFQEAAADSEKAIAIDSSIGVGHLNRGASMIGLERYDEALASLNEAIDLKVDKLQLAYFDRGLAKENKGDVRGAYYDYRKAVELDPTFQLAGDQLSRFTVKTR